MVLRVANKGFLNRFFHFSPMLQSLAEILVEFFMLLKHLDVAARCLEFLVSSVQLRVVRILCSLQGFLEGSFFPAKRLSVGSAFSRAKRKKRNIVSGFLRKFAHLTVFMMCVAYAASAAFFSSKYTCLLYVFWRP